MFTGGQGPPPPPNQQEPSGQAGPSTNFTGEYPPYEQGNVIRNREIMYRLMISQLFYDGYSQVAIQLTNILAVDPPCPPSERLLHVLNRGLEREAEEMAAEERGGKKNALADLGGPQSRTELLENLQGKGLNLEYDTEARQGEESAPEPALYETAYVTSHKANCRAGAFSNDGSLVATGSVDASIKILDVDRMLAKSQVESMSGGNKAGDPGSHPVIRTLYDHVEVKSSD